MGPLRWITTKIALIFAVLAGAALGLGLLATWTLDPLTAAFGGRYNSTWYDTQGLVPVTCMLFALAVGVAASAIIRRTIPAMAVTLVAYAAARIPVHWIRGHFWPSVTRNYTTPLTTLLQNPTAPPRSDFASHLSPSDWVQSLTITDPAGHTVIPDGSNLDVLANYCPNLAPPPGNVTRHGGTPSGSLHPPPARSTCRRHRHHPPRPRSPPADRRLQTSASTKESPTSPRHTSGSSKPSRA